NPAVRVLDGLLISLGEELGRREILGDFEEVATPAVTGGYIDEIVLDNGRRRSGIAVPLEDRHRPKQLAVLCANAVCETANRGVHITKLDVLTHAVYLSGHDRRIGRFVL